MHVACAQLCAGAARLPGVLASALPSSAGDLTWCQRPTLRLRMPPAVCPGAVPSRVCCAGKEYAAKTNVTLAYLRKMAGKGTALHPVVEALKDAVLEVRARVCRW